MRRPITPSLASRSSSLRPPRLPRCRRKWLCRDWDGAVALLRDRAPEVVEDGAVAAAAELLRREASDAGTCAERRRDRIPLAVRLMWLAVGASVSRSAAPVAGLCRRPRTDQGQEGRSSGSWCLSGSSSVSAARFDVSRRRTRGRCGRNWPSGPAAVQRYTESARFRCGRCVQRLLVDQSGKRSQYHPLGESGFVVAHCPPRPLRRGRPMCRPFAGLERGPAGRVRSLGRRSRWVRTVLGQSVGCRLSIWKASGMALSH